MDHAPGATHEALPLDPENDIDAKSATKWFIGSCIVLFGCLWILVPIFVQVQDYHMQQKVNAAPTDEINDIKDAEAEFLEGGNPAKKNIDDIVKALRPK